MLCTPKAYGHQFSWRYHKVEKFSFLIANQMQLEAKEPTHRAFSSLNYAFENLMNMYSLVLQTRSGVLSTKLYVADSVSASAPYNLTEIREKSLSQ